MSQIRQGKNAVQYIDEIMESPRFKVVMDLYNHGDTMSLRLLLIEMLRTSEKVGSGLIVRNTAQRKSLQKFELVPFIKHLAQELHLYNTYDYNSSLRKEEQLWYLAMVNKDENKKSELIKYFKGNGEV